MNSKRLLSITSVAAILLLLAPLYGSLPINLSGSSNPSTQPALTQPTHFTHPFVAASGSPSLGSQVGQCPLPAAQCWASLNWGGYAVTNPAYVVTDVKASWVVPQIVGSTKTTCPDVQRTWDSNAIWIGIDGFNNGYVEQTGTSSDCFYGQPSYYAWYEMYPAGSVALPPTDIVSPGDLVTAEVSYAPIATATGPCAGVTGPCGLYTTTITDVSAHWTFTSPVTTNCLSGPTLPLLGTLGYATQCSPSSSAEWIDESPYYDGLLGLTPVPQITMSSASATINGITHSISGWGSNVNWLLMVDYDWGPVSSGNGGETLFYTKAVPSSLGTGGNNFGSSFGSSFGTTWISSGP